MQMGRSKPTAINQISATLRFPRPACFHLSPICSRYCSTNSTVSKLNIFLFFNKIKVYTLYFISAHNYGNIMEGISGY